MGQIMYKTSTSYNAKNYFPITHASPTNMTLKQQENLN